MAPIGYVNNLASHRIEPDKVRAPLIAELFRLYATGDYSLKALVQKSDEIGLTHPRTRRRLFKPKCTKFCGTDSYATWSDGTTTAGATSLDQRDLFDR